MLVQLHVKNLALIEEAEVEFGPGLNILTGETGAGKSILLGSIQLILGARVNKNMIRENASQALVELLFDVKNTRAEQALRDMGIETEDGMVLLSRKMTEGRSISRINGETCTMAQMKAVSSLLIDVHGQHEHQSLLYRDRQLAILDAYGGDEDARALAETGDAYRLYQKCKKELSSLDMDEEKRNREMAFLTYEIQKIEEADLKDGEDEELEKKYRKLTNSRQIMEALGEIRRLTGYEEGAGDLVGRACREITRASSLDEDLSAFPGMLDEVDGLLNDFNRELSAYMEEMVFDEETFREVEERLNLINTMKSRYGKDISRILAYREEQKQKLNELEKYEENLEKAKHNLAVSKKKLKEKCLNLRQIRQKAALQLTEEIISGLKDLNFLDVRFRIRFDERKSFAENGLDEIEYEIATNPGEPVRPLAQIVSGGELSRIMLAIKAILADRDEIGTLIFDEIDTGISGRTAQKVSEKMAQIGKHRQVLCITHLPQIAAMADRHFEIEKQGDETGTATHIHRLDEEHSVLELARLLGGAEITKAVMESAREMKMLAGKRK